jgi:hypothetical protein
LAQDLIGRGQIAVALQTLPDSVEDRTQLQFVLSPLRGKSWRSTRLIGTVPEGTNKGFISFKGIVSQTARRTQRNLHNGWESLQVAARAIPALRHWRVPSLARIPVRRPFGIDQINDPTAREQAASGMFFEIGSQESSRRSRVARGFFPM